MKRILIALPVIVAGGLVWYFWQGAPGPTTPDEPVFTVIQPEPDEIENTSAEAEVAEIDEYPIEEELPVAEPEAPLPELNESDPEVREVAVELIGESAVSEYLVTDDVISRLVVTIDNLTARKVPANLLPVAPPDGTLETTEDTDPQNPLKTPQGDVIRQYRLDPVNERRYTPYVALLESLDAGLVAAQYQTYEPLFQQAYEQMGYPDADFTTRLLDVLDEMLAAPPTPAALRLIKPEAYYLFADPALEALPAGQKVMIRMGNENADRVKAKLRELRSALAARQSN